MFNILFLKNILIFLCLILSILFSNTDLVFLYCFFIESKIQFFILNTHFTFTLFTFVNELLMSLFFIDIGISIRYELLYGFLSNFKQRLFPLFIAISGSFFPIFIYLFFNFRDSFSINGWAITSATDIVLSNIVLRTLFKFRNLSIFTILLKSISVIDDIIAILIITLFYNHDIYIYYIIYIIIIFLFFKFFQYNTLIATLFFFILWYLFLQLGIHSTISGIFLVFFISNKFFDKIYCSIFNIFLLHFVNFFILPLFIFINSGLYFNMFAFSNFLQPIFTGIFFGLFFGKVFAILLSFSVFRRFNILDKLYNFNLKYYLLLSILCSIGFTMSIIISNIIFKQTLFYLSLSKSSIITSFFISLFFIFSFKFFI